MVVLYTPAFAKVPRASAKVQGRATAIVNPKPAKPVWACGVLQRWVVLLICIQDLSCRRGYYLKKEV